MSHYKLNKQCKKCKSKILDTNKSGYCNKHRDRTGKNNPFFGKKHDKETMNRIRAKNSIAFKKLWKTEEYRNKIIKGISKPRRDGFKKEQSERILKWYIQNPIQREIRSKQMKNSWKTGKIEPNINSINESKFEREILKNLKLLLPTYNIRKTTLRINGKWYYPDIRINKNIIIEFYGDYWHANPWLYKKTDIFKNKCTAKDIWEHDKTRILVFKNAGFRVLIVWQDEYIINKKKTINNIIKFINKYEN
jgi:G:T-mismatch repair DNA endonuclease (very short patch repair protein)